MAGEFPTTTLSQLLSRRRFLGGTAAVAAGLTIAPALLGCGDDDDDGGENGGASESKDLGTLGLQMVWIEGDTSMAGIWLGEDRKFFSEEGLQLNPRPAVDVDPTQIVLSGDVPLGINGLPQLLAAKAKGAKIKMVGAQFQKSPLCITARRDRGVSEFADLEGKKIGSDPASQLLLEALLSVNGISKDDYEYVTIGFEVTPLLLGKIDAMLGFATNTPALIEQEKPDLETVTFVAADHNLPLVDYPYFAAESGIDENRDQLTAFFAGAVKGWQAAIKDPAAATDSTVSRQEGADKAQVQGEVTLLVEDFVEGPYSNQNGLYAMDPDAIAEVSTALADVGLISAEVDPAELIDDSLLPS